MRVLRTTTWRVQLRVAPPFTGPLGAGQALARVAEQMAYDVAHLQTAVTSSALWANDESSALFTGIHNAVLGHALDALNSYVQQTS